jgi:hypothetical protein
MNESLEAIRILNTTEVAKILRVPPATLTRWLNAEHPPELPVIRIGSNKRFVLEPVLGALQGVIGRMAAGNRRVRPALATILRDFAELVPFLLEDHVGQLIDLITKLFDSVTDFEEESGRLCNEFTPERVNVASKALNVWRLSSAVFPLAGTEGALKAFIRREGGPYLFFMQGGCLVAHSAYK